MNADLNTSAHSKNVAQVQVVMWRDPVGDGKRSQALTRHNHDRLFFNHCFLETGSLLQMIFHGWKVYVKKKQKKNDIILLIYNFKMLNCQIMP